MRRLDPSPPRHRPSGRPPLRRRGGVGPADRPSRVRRRPPPPGVRRPGGGVGGPVRLRPRRPERHVPIRRQPRSLPLDCPERRQSSRPALRCGPAGVPIRCAGGGRPFRRPPRWRPAWWPARPPRPVGRQSGPEGDGVLRPPPRRRCRPGRRAPAHRLTARATRTPCHRTARHRLGGPTARAPRAARLAGRWPAPAPPGLG